MEYYWDCFCLFLVSLNHLHLLRNRIPRCVNFVHTLRDCCYAGASNFEFQNFLVLMECIAGCCLYFVVLQIHIGYLCSKK